MLLQFLCLWVLSCASTNAHVVAQSGLPCIFPVPLGYWTPLFTGYVRSYWFKNRVQRCYALIRKIRTLFKERQETGERFLAKAYSCSKAKININKKHSGKNEKTELTALDNYSGIKNIVSGCGVRKSRGPLGSYILSAYCSSYCNISTKIFCPKK